MLQNTITRSIVHNIVTPPIPYASGFSIRLNQSRGFNFLPRKTFVISQTVNMILATNRICPISTPTLNASSAAGISVGGKPISPNADANPNPCNKPKLAETKTGYRHVNVSLRSLAISLAKNTIDKAMTASTGGIGNLTKLSVASVNVKECATVKPVIVIKIRRPLPAINIRHATNNK